jgi:predicted nucleotidyltransferase
VLRPLVGQAVPCQRLEDLIAYKAAIGRKDDLRELTKLRDQP